MAENRGICNKSAVMSSNHAHVMDKNNERRNATVSSDIIISD